MAIEKRKLASGATVGYDTETKHYCPLPKGLKDVPVSPLPLDEMEWSDLKELAAKMGLEFPGNISKPNLISLIKDERG